ncbi:conjugal transfer protein TrbJ, partial [Proteus mirabilis]
MKKQRNLAAKIILLASLISNPFITSTSYASAGIPVADALNLQQNITSAMEAVAQTLQQIDQYKAQLLQYENQLQNTLAPAAYIWDQAQSTIN